MSKKVKIKQRKVSIFRRNSIPRQEELMTMQEFEATKCVHCGGAHLIACPRVKKLVFHTNNMLHEVEFWQDGQWDTRSVLWPDRVIDSTDIGEEA